MPTVILDNGSRVTIPAAEVEGLLPLLIQLAIDKVKVTEGISHATVTLVDNIGIHVSWVSDVYSTVLEGYPVMRRIVSLDADLDAGGGVRVSPSESRDRVCPTCRKELGKGKCETCKPYADFYRKNK